MLEILMNEELAKVWKEAVVANRGTVQALNWDKPQKNFNHSN
jgi:hypothetical protein